MRLRKPGTGTPYTDEDYVDIALARLERIAAKGRHGDHFTLYTREIKQLLTELVNETKQPPFAESDVKNTSIEGAARFIAATGEIL